MAKAVIKNDSKSAIEFVTKNYSYDEEQGVVYNTKTLDMGFLVVAGDYRYHVHETPYGRLNHARMAFAIKTGSMPARVKHIDGNRENCTWENLEPAGAVALGTYVPKS